MAKNLTNKLRQVGSAILLDEAAQQHQAMVQAYGKDIPIVVGYMSEWDWFAEAIACWNNPSTVLTDQLNIQIIPIISKLDATTADRQTAASFFQDIGGYTSDSENFGGVVNNWNWMKQTAVSPNLMWSAYRTWKTTIYHPLYPPNTLVYGFPNTLNLDPRRSGNFVLFDVVGNDSLLKWLFQNSYKYNFYFYGPLEGAFMYINREQSLNARTKKALSMGYNANGFLKAAEYLGRDPETEIEIEAAIQQILSTQLTSPAYRKARNGYLWAKIGLILAEET